MYINKPDIAQRYQGLAGGSSAFSCTETKGLRIGGEIERGGDAVRGRCSYAQNKKTSKYTFINV